jgi:3-hydroxybutyrate dehydrogenase
MLQGKTALVTGSTRGIGAATATALAAQGCNVMLNGFGEAEEIERQRAALADQHGVTVAYHGADLADLVQVEALMRQTQEDLGTIDILVNNAVIRYFHRIEDFVVEDWNHALAVNLSAPFHLIRLALPDMRKNGWGRIVNFSSALCPGSVLTPNTEIKIAELAEAEGLSPEAARVQYLAQRKQPTDFINPARIAEFIVFLCRDESRDINGAALPIDSGRSASWLD